MSSGLIGDMTTKKAMRANTSLRDRAKTVRIGDVDVIVATPAGKPKNRSAAEIRAAVRAHIQSAK